MLDLGAEVSFHKFHPQLNQFHPLHFFSGPDSGIIQENYSCSSYGINTVGIIRAPRGNGKETIVLVTPFDALKSGLGEALSVGIAYSIFSFITKSSSDKIRHNDILLRGGRLIEGVIRSVNNLLEKFHQSFF